MKYFPLIVILLLYSCNSHNSQDNIDEANKLYSFNWLEGEWQFDADSILFFEGWQKLNDSVLIGEGYMLIGEDTVSNESISVEYLKGDIYYTARVKGHNDGKRILFRLVSDKDSVFVFENKDHDFPNRITYKYIDSNHFEATVAGEANRVADSMVLFMTKIQR